MWIVNVPFGVTLKFFGDGWPNEPFVAQPFIATRQADSKNNATRKLPDRRPKGKFLLPLKNISIPTGNTSPKLATIIERETGEIKAALRVAVVVKVKVKLTPVLLGWIG
jgi:hypothetical protein